MAATFAGKHEAGPLEESCLYTLIPFEDLALFFEKDLALREIDQAVPIVRSKPQFCFRNSLIAYSAFFKVRGGAFSGLGPGEHRGIKRGR